MTATKTATRKPRITTLTVSRLTAHAHWLMGLGEQRRAAAVLRWAKELEGQDARETRADPSKRRRKVARG